MEQIHRLVFHGGGRRHLGHLAPKNSHAPKVWACRIALLECVSSIGSCNSPSDFFDRICLHLGFMLDFSKCSSAPREFLPIRLHSRVHGQDVHVRMLSGTQFLFSKCTELLGLRSSCSVLAVDISISRCSSAHCLLHAPRPTLAMVILMLLDSKMDHEVHRVFVGAYSAYFHGALLCGGNLVPRKFRNICPTPSLCKALSRAHPFLVPLAH